MVSHLISDAKKRCDCSKHLKQTGSDVIEINQKWKNIAASRGPSNRTKPALGAFGDNIYFFGGAIENYANGIVEFTNDTWVFNIKSEQWREIEIPEGQRPPARGFFFSVADEDNCKLYLYGGITYDGSLTFQDAVIFSDFWVFDAKTETWSEKISDNQGPGPRTDGRSVIIGNKFYLFAGISELNLGVFPPIIVLNNDLWEYNIDNNIWTELIPNDVLTSPQKRGNYALVATQIKHKSKRKYYCSYEPSYDNCRDNYEDVILLYGGEDALAEISTLGDTWIYFPSTNKWKEVTPSKEKNNISPSRNDTSIVSFENKVYVIFGDIPGGTGANPFENPNTCAAPFPQNPINELWGTKVKCHNIKWTKISPCISPDRFKTTTSVIIGKNIYTFSGWDFVCAETTVDGEIRGTGSGQVWNNDIWTLNIKDTLDLLDEKH